jgi:hypothetical protein
VWIQAFGAGLELLVAERKSSVVGEPGSVIGARPIHGAFQKVLTFKLPSGRHAQAADCCVGPTTRPAGAGSLNVKAFSVGVAAEHDLYGGPTQDLEVEQETPTIDVL